MKGARLYGTRLEGADLVLARLESADLREAQMEGADLNSASLKSATVQRAWMEGAILRFARLQGADLARARREGANLYGARLERAILFEARLEKANLREARLEGANLTEARMTDSDCAHAVFMAALADYAELTCKADTLNQSQLTLTVGNENTLLRRPLKVWSCLDRKDQRVVDKMPDIEAALARHPEDEWGRALRKEFEDRLWCKDGEKPREVGRWIEDQ